MMRDVPSSMYIGGVVYGYGCKVILIGRLICSLVLYVCLSSLYLSVQRPKHRKQTPGNSSHQKMKHYAFYLLLEVILLTLTLLAESSFAFNPCYRYNCFRFTQVLENQHAFSASSHKNGVDRWVGNKDKERFHQNRGFKILAAANVQSQASKIDVENVSVCIIGGGVSGLTAAFTAAERAQLGSRGALSDGRESRANKIVLLEASPTLGGRVQSDKTKDGYTLDRGFAVFIEEYPASKSILNYQDLRLGKFLPGALIKTSLTELQRVADPLRFPKDLFTSLVSNVGTLVDKLKILRLIYHVRTRSVEELFQEEEIDTLSLLEKHYGFSNKFITEFMKPFLEGIYLAPLEEQSSRMFHFVFKMFTEGAACLPEGGMGKVTEQLEARVRQASLKGSVNIDLKVKQPVTDIKYFEEDQSFLITTANNQGFRAKCVILATDGPHAHQLLTRLDEKTFAPLPEQPQRSVGCLYYSFQGDPPVVDPILILNGIGGKDDDSAKFHPVNNVCFPSAVSKGYAPEGYGLCSVTILEKACEYFKEKPQEELDRAVRKQLKEWFDDKSIISDWILQGCYFIPNAQPAQLNGPWAANVHGGRDCTSYQGKPLPRGFLICGDHMATATFNGALEAGVMAGEIAANFLLEKNPIKTK